MAEKALTPREERYCQEYTVCYVATTAAIRAGYSTKNAAKQGSKLMKDPRILRRIHEIQKELVEQLGITREKIVLQLMELVNICMAAKPVMRWNYVTHRMEECGEYVVDSKGAARALELLGRYLGMFDKEDRSDGDTGPVFISGEEELKE